MSQLNFWSITTGYIVKYLLPVGIEHLNVMQSTSETSEQVYFGGSMVQVYFGGSMAVSASFWLRHRSRNTMT